MEVRPQRSIQSFNRRGQLQIPGRTVDRVRPLLHGLL